MLPEISIFSIFLGMRLAELRIALTLAHSQHIAIV